MIIEGLEKDKRCETAGEESKYREQFKSYHLCCDEDDIYGKSIVHGSYYCSNDHYGCFPIDDYPHNSKFN